MKYIAKVEYTTECTYEFDAPKNLTQEDLEDRFWNEYNDGKTNCLEHEIDYTDGEIYSDIVPVKS